MNANHSATIPFLLKRSMQHAEHLKLLKKQFGESLSQLLSCKTKLQQYVEMNKSLAQELYQEDCITLAKQKEAILEKEELLQRRMEALLHAPSAHVTPARPSDHSSSFPLRTFGRNWNTQTSSLPPSAEGDSASDETTPTSDESCNNYHIIKTLTHALVKKVCRQRKMRLERNRVVTLQQDDEEGDEDEDEDEDNDGDGQVQHSKREVQPNNRNSTKEGNNNKVLNSAQHKGADKGVHQRGEEDISYEDEGSSLLATQLPAKKKRKRLSKNFDDDDDDDDGQNGADDTTSDLYLFQTQKESLS
eukprot:TRINITY_DN468_c1_g3_i2.p1 TRINITY_DN468_c1_g3~~TRINITY_DN468_c1_g3_i2.p1  ORF type:complete len:303 (+),score=96.17 TRINITY_DN468_c1_g3_i2:583-1491(+)